MPDPAAIPRTGMLATVRNRRALITDVEAFDAGPEGRLHLVSLEYTDADGVAEDRLVWEREPATRLLEATALPDPARDAPMEPRQFDALVRAARWSALTPFVDPDGTSGPLERLPIASPFHGALQVEDFQLIPLLRALRMPRIALLIADDVGLGKTIEAGLILTELILRRRVRRILILCPASLRTQWKQEMREKFSLAFDIVDRAETQALRKRVGLDANPWRTYQRVVTSYHYLKQPDVLEQFRAASRPPEGSVHLPWDLLIVDEAHNLSPATMGEESDLSKMLGQIVPFFEHRIFLTATPHNGYTRSFTGLLERLDPVRFTRRGILTPAERRRVAQVLVRRLKREVNARTTPHRFCGRQTSAVVLGLSRGEKDLSAAFQSFRRGVRALIAEAPRGERIAGAFALEILAKRLLSCPVAFADSWHRSRAGMRAEEAAEAAEVRAAKRAVEEETGDDREAEGRAAHAAQTVGAWLQPMADRLTDEIARIDAALEALDLGETDRPPALRRPRDDARFAALSTWIETHLRLPKGRWREDERLVIFTEYKTTLDYLDARLRDRYSEAGRVRVLFGGLDDRERDEVKTAFNDRDDPVRILIATDTAAEGLNLQETARYLLHYDVPWNPSRLEQRNGRLDRHGQARDVVVHHFATDDDADLDFLAFVVRKVDAIREDLGSTGEVFDAAFQKRFVEDEDPDDVRARLDAGIAGARGRADVPAGGGQETGEEELARLRALADEVDLDPESLAETLEVALGLGVGWPRFDPPDGRGRVRLRAPLPPRWKNLIDDTLRGENREGAAGALRALTFDPELSIDRTGERPVYRSSKDTALIHLGHPLYQRALAYLARARYPGAMEGMDLSRWTVRRGGVPEGCDALVLVTVEEIAANELREVFHHWVRTFAAPVRDGKLGDPLPHRPAHEWRTFAGLADPGDREAARAIWDEVSDEVRSWVRDHVEALTARLRETLASEGERAVEEEQERFQSRQGEISKLIEETTILSWRKEIEEIVRSKQQLRLFGAGEGSEEDRRSEEELREDVARLRSHYEELRLQLQKERERVIRLLLPRRYALRGSAQVFPVAVEVRVR